MKRLPLLFSLSFAAWICATIASAGIAEISTLDATAALREALSEGSAVAVNILGKEDGYFANPKVKIPLPKALRKIESGLRMMGKGEQADELVLSMNRAAEAAVPQAKDLLIEAIRQMSVEDARQILGGGDTAASDYFRSKTRDELRERFLPVVKQATDRVDLARQYNKLAGQGTALGVLDKKDASIESYVTRKTLDGLYRTIAEQEKALRDNPMKASSSIVRKVFGALGSN